MKIIPRLRKWIAQHKFLTGTVFSVLLLLFIGAYSFVYLPAKAIYGDLQQARVLAEEMRTVAETKDLDLLQEQLKQVDSLAKKVELDLRKLSYLKNIPYFNHYFQDAEILVKFGREMVTLGNEVIPEIKPYAEVLGWQKDGSTENANSDTELQQVIRVAPQLIPVFERVLTKLDSTLPMLNEIHVSQYPVEVRNIEVRKHIGDLVYWADVTHESIPQLNGLVRIMPSVVGAESPQTYLILFQNDKELRPTGGFITSYAMMTVDAGEISITDAKNIYEVSGEEAFLSPPEPIVLYLKQQYWRMRDTNFSPDFKVSMDTFHYYWQNLGLKEVDGIIALDTQFVARFLEILGPIEIADYNYDWSVYPNLPESCQVGGNLFTSENVVCRLELYAQRLSLDQSERKAVIGELMEQMFKRVMTISAEQLLSLWEVGQNQLAEKHILAYSLNPTVQTVYEKNNWAGRIINTPQTDYLHVNDANLAGLKSDMYLTRSVKQEYTTNTDGRVVKTVTLSYENTGTFDGWLNATARNYVRLYVPQGAELVSVTGGEVGTNTFDELEKTVFDNFLLIPPLEKREIIFEYLLPTELGLSALEISIQKQPGVEVRPQQIFIEGKLVHEFDLVKDEVLRIAN